MGDIVESREGLVLVALVATAVAVTPTPIAFGLAVDAAIGDPTLPLL